MSTPFNNQWVLGRARSRRRQRTTGPQEGAADAPNGSHTLQESPAATVPSEPGHGGHAPRHGGHSDPRLGLAFMARAARKRPRWIDRDT